MKKSLLLTALAILLCAGILLGVTLATRDVFFEKAEYWHLHDMQTILPGSETFVAEPYNGEDEIIRSVHKSDAGYVIETVTYGYAGEITVLVGVNNDGKVTGLVVLDAHETLGLGSRILTDHVFLSQFLNSSGDFAIATHGQADAFSGATGSASEGEAAVTVDGISGATVSSKAVIRCVNSAVAYVTGADISSGATSWGG
jgi:electron transport complex protein RnfG